MIAIPFDLLANVTLDIKWHSLTSLTLQLEALVGRSTASQGFLVLGTPPSLEDYFDMLCESVTCDGIDAAPLRDP